jgi:hypothetical protein
MRSFVQVAALVLIAMALDLASADTKAASPAATGSPTGDCCSPAAMKQIADSLGFIDVVGIKLGMSPQEALAAIKAYDRNLKIETLTARLYPSGTQGSFVRVPYSINAHTANTNTNNGPVEWIALRFTTPPNPPRVAKIVRYTGFPAGQPVMVSNLLDSLRKKYGQDNMDDGGYRAWVFDSNGKLLTRTLTSLEKGGCVGDGAASSVAGGGPADHPSGETGVNIDPDSTRVTQPGFDPERAPICVPLVFAAASNVGSSFAPSSQQNHMTVTLESGALMYNSTKATHDWLQAQLDAKTQQQNVAAKQRTGPKL